MKGIALDKTMIGLLGGASALALVGGAETAAASSFDQASTLEPARSYAELLDPIPDAIKIKRAASDSGDSAADEGPFEVAQYYYHHHHHHHHHRHHHHHHHHHHYY
jgi:hypothetical protein